MITEIVRFTLPDGMSKAEAEAAFEATAGIWKDNPDLIRKNYLLDMETRTAGGVYLWHRRADGEKWHDAEFKARIKAKFGSEPTSEFFETPIVVDNVSDEIVKGSKAL